MVERVIRSPRDPEEALALAARQGGCRIRVGEQVAALVVGQEPGDEEAERFLNHPLTAERLNRASQSLSQGRGIPHKDVIRY